MWIKKAHVALASCPQKWRLFEKCADPCTMLEHLIRPPTTCAARMAYWSAEKCAKPIKRRIFGFHFKSFSSLQCPAWIETELESDSILLTVEIKLSGDVLPTMLQYILYCNAKCYWLRSIAFAQWYASRICWRFVRSILSQEVYDGSFNTGIRDFSCATSCALIAKEIRWDKIRYV